MFNRKTPLFFALFLSLGMSSLGKADDQATNKQIAMDLVNTAIKGTEKFLPTVKRRLI